ncbi:interleukin-9 receptor-like [Carettochelys insculpta]|uniref:interleukin-9 receptor-like n=1 Tax=Carettochelys insculpta TaxID=44489 RepID=UPI003EB844C8
MGQDIWGECLQLCVLAILFSGRGEGREFPGNLSCLNNYVCQIDCTWETDGSLGDGPFHVHFMSLVEDENSSCTLIARDERKSQHHCTMTMAGEFTEYHSYRVSLQGGFSGRDHTYVAFLEYEPRLNIKYDPPFNLQSNLNASKCHLSWNVHLKLENNLQYELEYKKINASWEQAQHKQQLNSVTKIDIEATEFEAGIIYTARVRCKTSQTEEYYKSQWSEWSQITEFQRAASQVFLQVPEKSFDTSMIQILVIPLCLAVILYIMLNFRLSSRAKNIFCLNVPTPAAFFQPLYTLHNGNFKDWVGPSETCSQLQRNEAINPSKVTVGPVPDINAYDIISEFSKSLAKTKMIPQEDLCGSASRPDQQDLWSRYVSVEEAETKLPSLLLQNHAGDARALDFSKTNKTNFGSPDVSENHPPYLRASESDFFVPQESLEMESLSFNSNDYCTLCGSDSTGGPIPAQLLQLTEEEGLVKYQNDGTERPSQKTAACTSHQG